MAGERASSRGGGSPVRGAAPGQGAGGCGTEGPRRYFSLKSAEIGVPSDAVIVTL